MATSLFEGIGTFVGPLFAGLIIGTAGPAPAAGLAALGFAVAMGAALTIRVTEAARPPVHADRTNVPLRSGVRALRDRPAVGALFGSVLAQVFVRGLLTTLIVVVAVETLGLGEPGVGGLNAALGAGGIIGAGVALTLARRRRFAPVMALSLVGWGLADRHRRAGAGDLGRVRCDGRDRPEQRPVRCRGVHPAPARHPEQRADGGLRVARGVHRPWRHGRRAGRARPDRPGRRHRRPDRDRLDPAGRGAARMAPDPHDRRRAGDPRRCRRRAPGGPAPAPASHSPRSNAWGRTPRRPRSNRGRPSCARARSAIDTSSITAGEVEVSERGVVRRYCGSGEGVGEIALLRAVPRTATVTGCHGDERPRDPVRVVHLGDDRP